MVTLPDGSIMAANIVDDEFYNNLPISFTADFEPNEILVTLPDGTKFPMKYIDLNDYNENLVQNAGGNGQPSTSKSRPATEKISSVAKKLKIERNSDEDVSDTDDQEGRRGEKEKDSNVEEVELSECDVCTSEETLKKKRKDKAVSIEEKNILSFHYSYQVDILCEPHYNKIFKLFPLHQKICCNKQNLHDSIKKGTILSTVTLDLAQDVREFTNFQIKPFEKICKVICLPAIKEQIKIGRDTKSEQEMDLDFPSASQQSKHSNYSDCSEIQNQRVVNVPEENKTLREKAENFDIIMENARIQTSLLTKDQQKIILSIMPEDWSTHRLQEETGAKRSVVEDFKKFGSEVQKRRERSDKLSEADIQSIKDFFYQEDISRQLPGKIIFISTIINLFSSGRHPMPHPQGKTTQNHF